MIQIAIVMVFLIWPSLTVAEVMCTTTFEDGQRPTKHDVNHCVKWRPVVDPTHYRLDVVQAENGVTPRTGSWMAVAEIKEGAPPVSSSGKIGGRTCCHRLGGRARAWGADNSKTMWYGFSVYLQIWPESTVWRLFSNLHTSNCDRASGRCPDGEGTRKSTMAFQSDNSSGTWKFYVIVAYNNSACGPGYSTERIYSADMSILLNRWVDFVYQIHLDYDLDGWIKLWVNDKLYDPDGDGYTYKGATRYNDQCGPSLRWPVLYQNKAGSLPLRAYFDELRIARDLGDVSYKDVAPSGH